MEGRHFLETVKFRAKPEDDTDVVSPGPLLVTETVDARDGLGDENIMGNCIEGELEIAFEDGCGEDDGISSKDLHYCTIQITPEVKDIHM